MSLLPGNHFELDDDWVSVDESNVNNGTAQQSSTITSTDHRSGVNHKTAQCVVGNVSHTQWMESNLNTQVTSNPTVSPAKTYILSNSTCLSPASSTSSQSSPSLSKVCVINNVKPLSGQIRTIVNNPANSVTPSTVEDKSANPLGPRVVVVRRNAPPPSQTNTFQKKVLYRVQASPNSAANLTNLDLCAVWNGSMFVEASKQDLEMTAANRTEPITIRKLQSSSQDLSQFPGVLSALRKKQPSLSTKPLNGKTGSNEPMKSQQTTDSSVVSSTKEISSQSAPEAPGCAEETLAEDEFKVCKNCGALTKSVNKCESCQKIITAQDKTVKRVGPPQTTLKTSSQANILSKKTFYGNKLSEMSQPYGWSSSERSCGGGVPSNTRRSEGKAARGRPAKKRVKTKLEPETVTISSDEEDSGAVGSDQNNTYVISNCSMNTSLSDGASMPQSDTGTDSKPNGKEQNDDHNTSACEEPNPSSTAPQSTCASPEKSVEDNDFSIFEYLNRQSETRRNKMEDASGNIPLKVRKVKAPKVDYSESFLLKDPSVTLSVRCVRIGCLKSAPVEPVFLSKDGFYMKLECHENCCEVQVKPLDINTVALHLMNRLPVIYLYLTPQAGHRLKTELKPCSAKTDFFDPASPDFPKKFITLLLERQTDKNDHKTLLGILEHFRSLKPHRDNFIQMLTCDQAQNVLVQTSIQDSSKRPKNTAATAKSQEAPKEEAGQCAADPKVMCPGTVEKLFTYRPVSERGGISISTEDLFCLREGEFLNDVIIDFYLKYLVNEVLSEEDRNRTYVFSSFFYKRLTQRQGRLSPDDKQQMDLKERRHDRVKTWTRHVDLFSKDFIIVPINEHSHWFLAIICFPGLISVRSRAQKQLNTTPTSSPSVDNTPHSESMETSDDGSESNTTNPVDQFPSSHAQPCILVFDSLAGPARTTVVKTLREYLSVEWNAKKKTSRTFDRDTVRGGYPKVPQQNNFSDCGVFVLQFVESFFKKPITDFSIPVKGLQEWFSEEEVSRKREQLRSLILSLHQKSKTQSLPS
ncbi:sentrin-specific protease 6-like [Liolophura sinensis]|uniref:sentrin-specific protease 6-like n=1 Tax=Liolophura sinensis TaxID=3198878 RepID=UPI003158BD73